MKKNSKVITWLRHSAEEDNLKELMKGAGHDCIECTSKEQLLTLIHTHHNHIDLIVLDEQAAGSDVLTLCRELKENELLHSYLLLLAGSHSSVTETEALDNGADIFVQKPLKPVILLKRIDSVLMRK